MLGHRVDGDVRVWNWSRGTTIKSATGWCVDGLDAGERELSSTPHPSHATLSGVCGTEMATNRLVVLVWVWRMARPTAQREDDQKRQAGGGECVVRGGENMSSMGTRVSGSARLRVCCHGARALRLHCSAHHARTTLVVPPDCHPYPASTQSCATCLAGTCRGSAAAGRRGSSGWGGSRRDRR